MIKKRDMTAVLKTKTAQRDEKRAEKKKTEQDIKGQESGGECLERMCIC